MKHKANQFDLPGLENAFNLAGETIRKWDDPTYWKGVKIGQCVSCSRKDKDITRDGLCWLCDSARKTPITLFKQ